MERPLTQAFTQTMVSGASFTGLAINHTDTELFAANTAGGTIDAFNNSFQLISTNAFVAPTAVSAKGLVPFNVTDLGGNVFVTYAPSGHTAQTMATAGQGAVVEFSESGTVENTITNNALASPWGVAIAPSSFGKFGGDILVGNFSFEPGFADVINAFNPVTDKLVGSIDVNPGAEEYAGRSLVHSFRRQRERRKPEHPLLHRRHRRGEGRALRVDHRRPGTLHLGHDAGRIWRTRAVGCAKAARVVGDWLTNSGEPLKVGRFLSRSPADVDIFSSGANKCARSGLIAEE